MTIRSHSCGPEPHAATPEHRCFSRPWHLRAIAAAAAIAAAITVGTAPAQSTADKTACDRLLPAITAGYGADGAYAVDTQSVDNPAFRRKPVWVFLPHGAPGRRPVIFFAHGYGPGNWDTYSDLIHHWASRGYIVVFSSYPAIFSSNDARYDALWSGFEAAAGKFSGAMDLEHVGFAGHSFGGGATPAMAYRGLVEKGWGKQGAFLAELAPWYSFRIDDAQWQRFPVQTLQLVEIYDDDQINDHRMAIDSYKSSHLAARYFLRVHSVNAGGCQIDADHATPGRNPSLPLKQYGVFRPLDMLADLAFTGSTAARDALAAIGANKPDVGYPVISIESQPVPTQPESHYKYAWSSSENPRLQR